MALTQRVLQHGQRCATALASCPSLLATSSKKSNSRRWQSGLLRAIVEPVAHPEETSHISQGPPAAENNFNAQAGYANAAKKTAFVINNKNISYGEFVEQIGRVASLLKTKYQIQKGDRVLARTTKSLESIALYLATLQAGAIYVPLNPAYTQRETSHFIKDSEPKLFVTCKLYDDVVHGERAQFIIDENVLAAEAQKLTPDLEMTPVAPDDVAAICYTSGTTGLPKGAMLTHNGLATNAREVAKLWQFTPEDRLLHSLPIFHVHGLFISLHCSLFSNSTVILREKFDAKDVVAHLSQSTVFMGVPTYYSRLLADKDFERRLARNIRLFVSGSAPLSAALWKEFKEHTGQAILERYGMTEAIVIASNPYENDKRIPSTVGHPLPGTQARVSKDGIIEIKSPSLFKGYWRNPTKTREEFTQDGYFITGDAGSIDNDDVVRILGRSKDLVISGGLNIYPKEIEDEIDHLGSIAESAVIGVPHPDFGEAVVAVCVRKPTNKTTSEEDVVFELRARLTNYKLPKRVIFLPELPKNAMGKVQKNLLRDAYQSVFF